MTTDFTTADILDEFLPWVPQFKNPDCDPIALSDNSGAWISAHFDFDIEQFLMIQVRQPYLNPEGPTMVDYLFLHISAYGKREFEWDNHSHDFFDTSELMDPYGRFVVWVETLLEGTLYDPYSAKEAP